MINFSKSQAQHVLDPYHPVFSEIIETAWRRYRDEIPATVRLDLDRRARASVVWCLLRAEAKKVLQHRCTDVVVLDGNNTCVFLVDDVVALRFKKAVDGGATSNYMTQLQVDFRDPQLDFPGIPSELPRVDIGYVLNDLEDGVESVWVAMPDASEVVWSYEISDSTPVQRLDAEAESEEEVQVGPIVRPRRDAVEKKPATGTDPSN